MNTRIYDSVKDEDYIERQDFWGNRIEFEPEPKPDTYCEACGEKFFKEDFNLMYQMSLPEYICDDCVIAGKSGEETWEDVLTVISATKGQIFSVEFVKKNGTIRKMVCRTGVKKGINGNGKPLKTHLVKRVYDMQKQAWRSIPLDRVFRIRYYGQEWGWERGW